jgi:CheY-like chemotaxis protein
LSEIKPHDALQHAVTARCERRRARAIPRYSRLISSGCVNDICGQWQPSHDSVNSVALAGRKAALSKVPMISIVDDDRSLREATKGLVKSFGYGADAFASAEEFLQSDRVNDSACLILDVNMPGLSGIELQDQLIARGNHMPIIFISAVQEEATRAKALRAGAIGFLSKPFREEWLMDRLDFALNRDKPCEHNPAV